MRSLVSGLICFGVRSLRDLIPTSLSIFPLVEMEGRCAILEINRCGERQVISLLKTFFLVLSNAVPYQ